MPRSRRWSLLLIALVACHGRSALVAGKPYPTTVAEAEAERQRGVTWSDVEIRAHYLRLVATIASRDAELVAAGRSVEERARAAYQIRHDARATARAMILDPVAVEALRLRDRAKYGDGDGPTFDGLLDAQRAKGRTGDAAFAAILESAQRTNTVVDFLER